MKATLQSTDVCGVHGIFLRSISAERMRYSPGRSEKREARDEKEKASRKGPQRC